MKTYQEVYSLVRNHLLTQADRAVGEDEGDTCRYRDYLGRTCAVGCLIPAEHYNPKMEEITIRQLRQGRVAGGLDVFHKTKADALEAALIASGVPVDSDALELLQDLQRVHDGVDSVETWEDELDAVADKHNLSKE